MIRTSARSAVPAARFGALGLAAILVLGGCSGDGGDPNAEAAEAAENNSSSPSVSKSFDPTGSASPSATPTPTAAAYKPATAEGPAENVPLPVMPELAKEESAEGLKAFATHWYALMNYGFETGEVEPMKQISGPDCVVCGNVYRLLGNGYDEEDWIFGGELVVMSTKTNYVVTSKGVYQVLIQIRQDPYEFRGPGGLLYGENDGVEGTTVQMIEATYNNGQWFAHNAVTIQ
ncbi:DUF6318 family protein [Arthrobacter sunyaminii]|uniref:DUF6318 domain-containing protein n=1 Tax=Arthrobacter sunyaminii TaxID=2816859 RepID=A0A975PCI6_9MICC|nr:DUF6318 family protein [Arthrobacter sunyaminii]MBO0907660.1 hypothetical protein [Arthrobacter sunyaminii]QWQ35220.1 hypothetical protein KG104_12000 [Arthrobacter sunyaminii]